MTTGLERELGKGGGSHCRGGLLVHGGSRAQCGDAAVHKCSARPGCGDLVAREMQSIWARDGGNGAGRVMAGIGAEAEGTRAAPGTEEWEERIGGWGGVSRERTWELWRVRAKHVQIMKGSRAFHHAGVQVWAGGSAAAGSPHRSGMLLQGQSLSHVIGRLTAAAPKVFQLGQRCLHNPTQPPAAAQRSAALRLPQLSGSLSIHSSLNGSRALGGTSGLSSARLLGSRCCVGGSRVRGRRSLGGSGVRGSSRLGSGCCRLGCCRLRPELHIHFTQGQLLDGIRGPPDGDVLPHRGAAIGACGAHKALALAPHNAGDACTQAEIGGGCGPLPRLRADLQRTR